jgi:DNA polymerase-3 subunit epsilon
MRILFFDTETNGLPWNRHASHLNVENWPRILQIAWQVWYVKKGEKTHCLHRVNTFVKPDPAMKWDSDAAKIHKMTLDELQKKGKQMKTVLYSFIQDCKEVDLIVAHNLKFDKMALWAEAVRQVEVGHSEMDPQTWWPSQQLCTMDATVQICKIPAKNPTPEDPYKWPRLSELFQFLFPTTALPDSLHDAHTDVNCLIQCVKELIQRRLVVLPVCVREADFLVAAFRGLTLASKSAASSAR